MINSRARFISPSVSLSFVAAEFIDQHHALIFELIISSPLCGSYDPDVAKKVITLKSNLHHGTSGTSATITQLIRVCGDQI
jgi:hypothetical protein